MSRARFNLAFPESPVLLTVIHAANQKQVFQNFDIAMNEGADGVFLINHSIRHHELLRIYAEVRSVAERAWIGLNILDRSTLDAANIVPFDADGLWVDNLGLASAEQERNIRNERMFRGLYFGGVAFKYQKEEKNPAAAAYRAIPYTDVVTTSGEGTGRPPSVEKIESMRAALGDHPLAIASGMTVENVEDYIPYTDAFLVATGISDNHTQLNRRLVREMVIKIGQAKRNKDRP